MYGLEVKKSSKPSYTWQVTRVNKFHFAQSSLSSLSAFAIAPLIEKNEDSFENPQWDHVNKTPVRYQDYKCPQHMEAYLILNDSVFYL